MKLTKDKFILMLGEFFDRLNFYGLQSVLILYLLNVLFLSKHATLTIYGAYSSLSFVLPIVGGFLVDRFSLNRKKFTLIGIILILAGDTLLVIYPQKMLLCGLTLILVGIGFFKSNNAVLFGSLCQHVPKEKDAAFTYYYGVMNAGAIAGPLIYGNLDIRLGWKYGFIATIIGFSISLIFYLLRYKSFQEIDKYLNKVDKLVPYKIGLLNICLFISVYLCLNCYRCLAFLLLGSIVAVTCFFLHLIKRLTEADRKKVILLTIAMCYGVFFYAASLQVASSLLLYLNTEVHTKVLGFTIPSEYFMSVYSIFILILTPVSVKVWRYSAPNGKTLINRVSLSIYLAAASFSLIAISALFPNLIINWQLILVLLGLIILSFGELTIGPIITSAVTYLAPIDKHGTFMGLWYLFIGYSAYIASLMAGLISSHHNRINYGNNYFQNFLLYAMVTLVIAISITLMKKKLTRLYLN